MTTEDAIVRAAAARTPEELAELVGNPELCSRDVVERLAKAVLLHVRRDWDQAESLARAANGLAALLGDDYSRGLGARSMAHVAYVRGRCEEALDHYATAERRFREAGEDIEVGITLSSSLQSHILLGQYAAAFAAADQAREIFETGDDALLAARLDCNVGNILHRLDRMEEALDHYGRAIEAFESREADPQDLAAVLLNTAVCQIALSLFAEAAASYQALRRHCLDNDMPAVLAQADYNVAYLYYRRGEYTQAIERYAVASEHCREVGDSQHLALCHLDLAELYLELNLTAEARKQAESSFAAFEELGLRHEIAKSLAFLAIAAYQEGNAFLALSLFDEASERYEAEGNDAWVALVDFYRALILQEEGRSIEARRLAAKVLPQFRSARSPSKAVVCELLLARIELAAGNPESALDKCDAACATLATLEMPTVSYQAFLTRGQVSEALGDLEGAAKDYRRAFDSLENLRSQLRGEELKIAFVKDKQAVYESLVWVSLIGEPSPDARVRAFEYSERAKSRSLADLLGFPTHAPLVPAGTDAGLVREMRRLREELNWYYRETDLRELESMRAFDEQRQDAGHAAGEPLPNRPVIGADSDELSRRSREHEDQLIEILTEMQSQGGDLASLRVVGSRGLEAIRAALPAGGKLLQYYEARRTIFAFVVGHDTLEATPVTTASSVRRVQSLLQFQLSKFRLGPRLQESRGESLELDTRFHLQGLYDELIAPIRGAIDCEHLVVVPHGSLNCVPFHALHDGGGYLVDDLVISYAPSASVYEICATKPATRNQGSIVLGVPDRETPSIEEEARAVAGLLPDSRLFLGPDAGSEAIRGDGGVRASLLHIATHGFFRSDNPMFSAIQLGDSRLTLFDLYQLRLAADFVVLTGCGLGLNMEEGVDEPIGLIRGLLFAGARTVVTTLWDAQDGSATELMLHLYRRLGKHSNRAVALREAMLELRETHPHPYYWAPFVLSGAP